MSHPAVSHQGNFHGNTKENEVKREKERIRVGGSLTPSTLEIPKKNPILEKTNACFHKLHFVLPKNCVFSSQKNCHSFPQKGFDLTRYDLSGFGRQLSYPQNHWEVPLQGPWTEEFQGWQLWFHLAWGGEHGAALWEVGLAVGLELTSHMEGSLFPVCENMWCHGLRYRGDTHKKRRPWKSTLTESASMPLSWIGLWHIDEEAVCPLELSWTRRKKTRNTPGLLVGFLIHGDQWRLDNGWKPKNGQFWIAELRIPSLSSGPSMDFSKDKREGAHAAVST